MGLGFSVTVGFASGYRIFKQEVPGYRTKMLVVQTPGINGIWDI